MHARTFLMMYGCDVYGGHGALRGASFRVVDVDQRNDIAQISPPFPSNLRGSDFPTTDRNHPMANETLEWKPGPRAVGSTEAAIVAVCSISGPFTATGGVDATDNEIAESFKSYLSSAPDDDTAFDAAAAGAMDLQRSVPVSKQIEALRAGRPSPDQVPDRSVTFYRHVGGGDGSHFTRLIPVDIDAMLAATERVKERQAKAEEEKKRSISTTTETKTVTTKESVDEPFVPPIVNAPTGGADAGDASSKVAPEGNEGGSKSPGDENKLNPATPTTGKGAKSGAPGSFNPPK